MLPMLHRVSTPLANIAKFLFKDKTEAVIFFLAFLVEIAFGLYLVYRWGFTFTEGDAVSHLYIARTVADNGALSGFQNLGTVWLPMFHLLVMPLVLIDPLYTTGLAGTIVNALATGGICVILHRLIGGGKLGVLASVLFICNVFTLIYGATPMMEQTAIFFMVLAAYYLKCYWEKDDITEFMKCSLALILGTLTRYEVWVVAVLAIFFFVLRELKNGREYRLAYAHLPLWGIFAWLFWNLAIFGDPLMFINHPMSAQARALRTPPYFAGDFWLSTKLVFSQLLLISGLTWLFALPVMFLIRKKPAQIIPTLLTSPIFFHQYLMYAGVDIHYDSRFFYMGFPGLLILSIFFVKELNKQTLKNIAIIAIVVTYFLASPIQINSQKELETGFMGHFIISTREMKAIKEVVAGGTILWDADSAAHFSISTSTSPSMIFDDYDYPFFIEVMDNIFKNPPTFVIINKKPDNAWASALNDYYEGKFYIYRYYNDEAWRSTFLKYYKLELETEHFLVYRNIAMELTS